MNTFIKVFASAVVLGCIFSNQADAQSRREDPTEPLDVTAGQYTPDWESVSEYSAPLWWRDAKFGIWAHWGPQCQAAAGDWYARNMYIEGTKQYKQHLEKYGHPSEFGFKDVINEWKADKFNAQELLEFYKSCGARYFYALAVHHDNFDLWNSEFQPWNSVNMGPKRDLLSEWATAAKNVGLPLGLSFHARSAWTWYEPAQLADTSGAYKGIPYDGCLTKEDGKGKWWEGYDPQDLYLQNHRPSKYARDREKQRSNPGELAPMWYSVLLYNRIRDAMKKYQPEMLYFDEPRLPFLGASPVYGLSLLSSLFNESMQRNGGTNNAVMNCKTLTPREEECVIGDLEVATKDGINLKPWQCDACIGGWHYREGQDYVSAGRVVRALADVVSKNGNLLLSVPIRGDGTIDEQERKIVSQIGQWLNQYGEAIYGTRPWVKYGEGPITTRDLKRNKRGELRLWGFGSVSSEDMRFTRKDNTLYVTVYGWPENRKILIKSLAINAEGFKGHPTKVTELGYEDEPLEFKHTHEGLEINIKSKKPGYFMAMSLKIEGLKLETLPGIE